MEIIGNINTTESPETPTPSAAVQNLLGVPSVRTVTNSTIPVASGSGILVINTDNNKILRDAGVGDWQTLSDSTAPSGAFGAIQLSNGAGLLSSDPLLSFTASTLNVGAMSFDNSTSTLAISLASGPNPSLLLAAPSTEPTPPPAGSGRFYARNYAGRTVPKWVGPSGVDYMLQSHLGGSNMRVWRGGASTSATAFASTFGSMPYTSASPTAPLIPALTSTNILTQAIRSTIRTSATAGTIAFIRSNNTQAWRGNAAGLGGFLVIIRFGVTGALQANMRCFAGMVDSVANPTNIDPVTTNAPSGIGMAINASTGNWRLVHNAAGTVRSAVDLGVNFTLNNSHLLELALFAAPNSAQVSYLATNITTGSTATGVLTANIPSTGAFLAPSIWITNNTTAAIQQMDFVSCYIETDN